MLAAAPSTECPFGLQAPVMLRRNYSLVDGRRFWISRSPLLARNPVRMKKGPMCSPTLPRHVSFAPCLSITTCSRSIGQYEHLRPSRILPLVSLVHPRKVANVGGAGSRHGEGTQKCSLKVRPPTFIDRRICPRPIYGPCLSR